jgi:PAS domain S-box-containing protein
VVLRDARANTKVGTVDSINNGSMKTTALFSRTAASNIPSIALVTFAVAIFLADTQIDVDVDIPVLYVAVVLMSALIYEVRGIRIVALGCAVLTLAGYLLSPGDLLGTTAIANRFLSLSAIGATTVLATRNRSAQIALQDNLRSIATAYKELEQRGTKIRRLIDANIIGIFIWNFEGDILEANDAFLRIVGYDRDDLTAGRLRWTELTPSEWLNRDAQEWVPELGSAQPFEKEYFCKDGSRVPVLVGGALFGEGDNQGVAYILDLTERKRAEAAARDSDQRYRQVQIELAHANRVATMGQLTGSIAHEVNQPIAAMVIGAQTALRRLDRQPPDPEQVRQSFAQIVKYGTRAGEVVGRIRDLIKKAPPQEDLLDINVPIREVIELTRSDATKSGVSVKGELTEGLPLIRGDRVQLQQVMLNLIINAFEAMSDVSDGVRELLISTGKAGPGEVLVVVRDSGPGLAPPTTCEKIFDTFYTTKPAGLGMGLSICRSIIEAHGGRLWVSANLPRGASFQFVLPAITNTAS